MFALPESRQRAAYFFCIVGMAIDGILGAAKVLMGYRSGSVSTVGDGLNNITDVGAVLLLLLTFYYAVKPSDKEHPFGHGRLEYINSTVMASVVLYVGIMLCVDSFQKILSPTPVIVNPYLIATLFLGIFGKLALSFVYRTAAKKTGAEAFRAYGADSISDVMSTAGVLVAIAVESATGLLIDGYVGVLVSFLIMYTGYTILKHALNSIIGTEPDEALYADVKAFMEKIPGIYGVHDLIIHDYGPENRFLSAHVEVDSRLDLVSAHEICEHLTDAVKETYHMQAVVHADPKAVGNPREKEYRRDLESAIFRTGLPLSYHDFYVEEHDGGVYMTFEISFTAPCRLTDEEIYEKLSAEIYALKSESEEDYYIDMMIDRNFVSGKRYGTEWHHEGAKI